MTMRTPSALALRQSENSVEIERLIQRRAYQLYEQRGREDGRELDDWLQAEAEVRQNGQDKAA